MGYDFIIQYHSGHSNVVANALCRTSDHSKGMLLTLSMLHFIFMDELKGDLVDNPEFSAL